MEPGVPLEVLLPPGCETTELVDFIHNNASREVRVSLADAATQLPVSFLDRLLGRTLLDIARSSIQDSATAEKSIREIGLRPESKYVRASWTDRRLLGIAMSSGADVLVVSDIGLDPMGQRTVAEAIRRNLERLPAFVVIARTSPGMRAGPWWSNPLVVSPVDE